METDREKAVESDGQNAAGEDLAGQIDLLLGLPEKDWSQYSPLTLAWIGDTVYDLIVRTALVKRANMQADKLHRKAAKIVCAPGQAELIAGIRDRLTPEEESVYRRGRNSSPRHTAKNSERQVYLEATGFETLIGYLYLKRRYRRILELVCAGTEGAL